jgi:hypothetical protein
MRQSLFEYILPAPPKSLLQPNFYAKIGRFSYRHASAVILFWGVLCATAFAISIFYANKPKFAATEFADATAATQNLAILDQEFPNLNGLITIYLTNPDPTMLKLDRLTLIADMEVKGSPFTLVFAPGAGDYYEKHAIFYYPVEEIVGRVSYAKSLTPLFTAVAASPTTESLATLVNEVSASITLGRDPQGLDALFEEAAKSIQSLMEGNNRPVDWTKIAGLNFDPLPVGATILALPKLNQNAAAANFAKSMIDNLQKSSATVAKLEQATSPTPVKLSQAEKKQVLPFLALVLVCVGFMFFAAIGRLNLCLMIALPVAVAMIVCGAAFWLIFGESSFYHWAIILGVFFIALQISTRLTFAVLETLSAARGRQSATMLALQKQGAGSTWLCALATLVLCSWFTVVEKPFSLLAGIGVVSLFVVLSASFTLIPAMVRLVPGSIKWRAADWLLPIFAVLFENRAWRSLRTLLTIALLGVAISGVWLAPTVFQRDESKVNLDAPVNVLASSRDVAEADVNLLKLIPQAKGLRWLGAFLPQQTQKKRLSLQGLKNQFPHFMPLTPQEPATLREQIDTLLISLQEIATSSATKPELQKAAHNFRRSLSLLAATSSDGEVLELENRIFGAFNLLAAQADALADIEVPKLETLDPELKSLFETDGGVFRLEISPIAGISNLQLSQILTTKGLRVAHPALQAKAAQQALYRSSAIILAAALVVGFLTLVFVIGDVVGVFVSVGTTVIGGAAIIAIAYALHIKVSTSVIEQATMLFAGQLVLVATAVLKRQTTERAMPDVLHATEAWFPSAVIIAIAAPAVFLNVKPWAMNLGSFALACAVMTLAVALLQHPFTAMLRKPAPALTA